MSGPAIYIVCKAAYDPSNPASLNFGFGNFVGELVSVPDPNGNGGDCAFKVRGQDAYYCRENGQWVTKPDTSDSGCRFYLNGSLATYNPEDPGESGRGVIEFRVSRINNA